jgi:hypothetical protein
MTAPIASNTLGVNVFTAPGKAMVGERLRPFGEPLGFDPITSTLIFGEHDSNWDVRNRLVGSMTYTLVKIFELVAARTGLRDFEARRAAFDPFTPETKSWDHKGYYPGAQELTIRVSGDRVTDRFLGAQLLGHIGSEISKRVDVYVSALFHDMKVDDLNDLDLSYTPPLPVLRTLSRWRRNNGRTRCDLPNIQPPSPKMAISRMRCPVPVPFLDFKIGSPVIRIYPWSVCMAGTQ